MSSFPKMWGLAVLTLMCTHLLASGYESVQWPGVQAGAANTSGGCSLPFLAVGDQCLYFATFAELAYEEARQVCHSLDGKLAAVLTATSLKNIIDYIYGNGLIGKSFWIDGSDQETEGDWRTASGVAVPMGTPFFSPGEPNNVNGVEDCLELLKDDFFYFNDRPCTYINQPLCEQERHAAQTAQASPEELDCPPFFVSVGGLCLAFMTWAEETWAGARQACHGLSGELAAITDIEQLRAIYLYLHQEGIADHSFWLGGSDAATEGVWTWSDGQLVTMGSPFWGSRYVEHKHIIDPSGGSVENCLLLDANGRHFFWDASCNLLMSPLCMTLK